MRGTVWRGGLIVALTLGSAVFAVSSLQVGAPVSAAAIAVPAPELDLSVTSDVPTGTSSPVEVSPVHPSSPVEVSPVHPSSPVEVPPVPAPSARPNTETSAIPAPDTDTDTDTATPARTETVVLAGGCFWGVQGVFQHVKGVLSAESGYTGGSADTADYEDVSTGTTGHAEAVRIVYDPSLVTFGDLLQIFFAVVHDPTQLDRQGPDTGSQYRSAVFAQNTGQWSVAEAYVAQLTRQAVFAAPIVTVVDLNTEFFPAESYHQNYLVSHPNAPYIVMNDAPKVDQLEKLFPALYRAQPALMVPAGN